MRRTRRGLTLLEVLGAVALLGILYTVLARSAIEGVRSEGESRRRLRASLLADERIGAIERAASAPPLGSSSEELDDFEILTEVRAFEAPSLREDAPERSSGPRSLAARRAEAERKEVPSLFEKPESPSSPPPLVEVDLLVRWKEGIEPREVRRTTFALDPEAIEELFATVASAGAGAGAEADAKEPDAGGDESGGEQELDPNQPLPNFQIPIQEDAGEP